jgi:hypothetical protein
VIALRILLRLADWLADLAISAVCWLERRTGREQPPVDVKEPAAPSAPPTRVVVETLDAPALAKGASKPDRLWN